MLRADLHVVWQVLVPSKELASKHYAEHDGKPFFPKLVDFLSSGAVVATVWEGKEIVKFGRTMIGATNPLASAPGTIRFARPCPHCIAALKDVAPLQNMTGMSLMHLLMCCQHAITSEDLTSACHLGSGLASEPVKQVCLTIATRVMQAMSCSC